MKCDFCPREGLIPYQRSNYCYRCWLFMWGVINEEVNNDQKTKEKSEEEQDYVREEKFRTRRTRLWSR